MFPCVAGLACIIFWIDYQEVGRALVNGKMTEGAPVRLTHPSLWAHSGVSMLRKTYRHRIHLLLLIPLLAVCALIPRLYVLQVSRRDHYRKLAAQQQTKTVTIVPCRGKILDRNLHELAGSRLMNSAYVDPAKIPDEHKVAFAHEISRAVSIPFDEVYARMTRKGNSPLARKLSNDTVRRLEDVCLDFRKRVASGAIYFLEEGKREYSRDELASHVIGFTQLDETGDNTGLAGVEVVYNDELRGKKEKARVRTNAVLVAMEPADASQMFSTYGNSVVLTLDDTIQHAAQTAIVAAVERNQASAGMVVVMAVKTGEILALANCPTFNLTDRRANPDQFRNRAVADSIEPGSVMKILTYAAAIDEDKLNLNDMINCEGGRWNVHGRTVSDSHMGTGVVSALEAFATSSNVGAVKVGMRMTPVRFHERLVRFGLGESTGLDLPGESPGLLRNVRNWTAQSMSSIPMGYELRVTGIQMAAAVSAIANNGIYMKPHVVREIRDFRGDVVKRIEPQALRRVCSPATSRRVLRLMEEVVVKGTGKAAALDDYRVGGKTGTSRKIDPETRQYGRSYVGSFCGVAPLEDPEIVVYIYIDNPRGSSYYGGTVAAPTFKDVASVALKSLKVPMEQEADPSLKVAILTSERMRTELEGRVPVEFLSENRSDDEVSSDTMPNLGGMSMKEASEHLANLRLPFEFEGTGVVVDQVPRPYVTIEPGEKVQLTFAPRQEYMGQLVVDAARREAGLQSGPPVAFAADKAEGELMLLHGDEAQPVRLTVKPSSLIRAPLPRPANLPDPEAEASAAAEADPAVERKVNKAVAKDAWGAWKKEREKAALEAKKAASEAQTSPAEASEAKSKPTTENNDSAPASMYDVNGSARTTN